MIVEVAFAELTDQTIISLDLASGATVLDALRAASAQLPEITLIL